MAETTGSERRRYLPLLHRVAGLNTLLLIATVVVSLVVLAPRRTSSPVVDEEVVVVIAALIVMLALNVLLLRRLVGPVQAVTALARHVDLADSAQRLPGAESSSEAGELALAFNEMLARLEAERRDATGRVLAGQEAERLRVAQELHDQVGQELTAALLVLSRVSAHAAPDQRGEVLEAQDAVRASLEDVRRIAIELRPEALDDLGLESALAVLCERFAERSGLRVELGLDRRLPELSPEVELVIYRVAQEALTNVARHSGSDQAELRLRAERGAVVLTVADHGRGLAGERRPGSGIRGMRERAGLIGARLRVGDGADGTGCEVRLDVPLNAPAEVQR
ncbi:MAG: HAMP domain-containing sensor histidine kinase [Solirubrobacteraceae bacterium]